MELDNILKIINRIAPEDLQESWDNCGIQVNDSRSKDIKRIMTCLEISDAVAAEAVEKGCDMIVTHHPLIFSGLKQVDAGSIIGNQIIELLKNGITVYSSHTAFDSAAKGTNQDLAERLELNDIQPMVADTKYEGCGMGRLGSYPLPMDFEDFTDLLNEVCPDSGLRIAGRIPEYVRKVALCTGSGAEFIDMAAEMGADVYITGDVKYHDARHADDLGFCVIDAGHYGTEILFAGNMAGLLYEELQDQVEIVVSESDINPFV